MVIQVDQSIERAPICAGKVPCVTPRGKYWLSKDPWNTADKLSGRLLAIEELARVQGVGDAQMAGCELKPDSKRLQDFVGNSFTAPVIGALIVGALVSHA